MGLSRDVMVAQMTAYIGAKTGNAKHRHIIDTYNAHKPLARGYTVKYTDPWCATTVSSASIECGYTAIIPTECSCSRMIKLLQNLGSYEPDDNYCPSKGDIIFYNWGATTEEEDNGADGIANHVGVVSACDGKYITVIEGNYNGECKTRKIKVGWKYICGYGLPKYSSRETYYVVCRGDNLSKIAKKYNTTVSAILKLNPEITNPNVIYIGQKVRVR